MLGEGQMAKIKATTFLGDDPHFYLDQSDYSLGLHNTGKAVFVGENGRSVVFAGHDFTYKHGQAQGKVEDITIIDDKDHVQVTIAGHLDLSKISTALVTKGFYDAWLKISAGDDTLVGSRKGDNLFGGKGDDTFDGGDGDDFFSTDSGNDRFTGGGGSDHFLFFANHSHDVITDFDIHGKVHDVLSTGGNPFTMKQAGDDALIELSDGSTMRLLHVQASELTDVFVH
jgi:Ca2+-binding RTX toxin-like protein